MKDSVINCLLYNTSSRNALLTQLKMDTEVYWKMSFWFPTQSGQETTQSPQQ